MTDDNLFWLDAMATSLRRRPLWMATAVVILFLLLPFGIAYLDGSLPTVIQDGEWRIILLPAVIIAYSLLMAPAFGSSYDQIAASIRPLSQLSDEEYDEVVASACARNSRNEWIAFGVGVVVGMVLFGLRRTYHPLLIYVMLSFLLMYGVMGWIVYKAVASSRLSRELSHLPLNVDVFDITPFEPIGRQSLMLSMALVGGTTISLLFVVKWEGFLHWRDIVTYTILILVTVLVFFLNMWPTHRLISKTKKYHLQNAAQAIADAYHDLLALTKQNRSTAEVETRINAWATVENRLKLTRTWPYNTEMLRTLLLTVLTPIAVGISKIIAVLITSGRP